MKYGFILRFQEEIIPMIDDKRSDKIDLSDNVEKSKGDLIIHLAETRTFTCVRAESPDSDPSSQFLKVIPLKD